MIEAAVPGFSVQGCLSKMAAALPGRQDQPVVYHLRLTSVSVNRSACVGREQLPVPTAGEQPRRALQGHCYPCFKRLAQCDTCIMKPETCHFFQGTCREPEWGERHCFQPHIVYLANSSGLKVGITRKTQMPTRWLDQGAIQALPILEVDTRQQSGFVEMLFKEQVADRTNWRAMLKGDVETMDLSAERDRLLTLLADGLHQLRETHGADAIRLLEQPAQHFHYPVSVFPKKVVSHNFDKQPLVEGVLQGVKGQYLILDSGVINLRKFTGYEIQVS